MLQKNYKKIGFHKTPRGGGHRFMKLFHKIDFLKEAIIKKRNFVGKWQREVDSQCSQVVFFGKGMNRYHYIQNDKDSHP